MGQEKIAPLGPHLWMRSGMKRSGMISQISLSLLMWKTIQNGTLGGGGGTNRLIWLHPLQPLKMGCLLLWNLNSKSEKLTFITDLIHKWYKTFQKDGDMLQGVASVVWQMLLNCSNMDFFFLVLGSRAHPLNRRGEDSENEGLTQGHITAPWTRLDSLPSPGRADLGAHSCL